MEFNLVDSHLPPDPAQEQPVDILYKIIIIKTEKKISGQSDQMKLFLVKK